MEARIETLEEEKKQLVEHALVMEEQFLQARHERDTLQSTCEMQESVMAKMRKCSCKNPKPQVPQPAPKSNIVAPKPSTSTCEPPTSGGRYSDAVKSTKPKTMVPKTCAKPKVTVLASSMGRGLATQLNKQGRVQCYGSVNPSAGAEHLARKAGDVLHMTKPDAVVLLGGTNNISDGERPSSVISKIHGLVQKCKAAEPTTPVIVSGLLPRPMDKSLNHTTNIVNSVLSKTANKEGFIFLDNSRWINNSHLKRDGLHPNNKGIVQLSSNIEALLVSFHNGHQKIYRNPNKTPQPVPVQLSMRHQHAATTNPWW
jgi:lysophospholipase L1-like esterase